MDGCIRPPRPPRRPSCLCHACASAVWRSHAALIKRSLTPAIIYATCTLSLIDRFQICIRFPLRMVRLRCPLFLFHLSPRVLTYFLIYVEHILKADMPKMEHFSNTIGLFCISMWSLQESFFSFDVTVSDWECPATHLLNYKISWSHSLFLLQVQVAETYIFPADADYKSSSSFFDHCCFRPIISCVGPKYLMHCPTTQIPRVI